MNDFKAQWAEIGEEVHAATERVGESGWLVLGGEVRGFEEEFARYAETPEAIGYGNCLDATEMALRSLEIQPGDEVITTPLSAFATTLAIVRAGGHPVFIDTDASGQIDLALVRNYLESGGSARFFVPVHLYGHSINAAKLATLRDDYDLKIVEDCAQAIGAKSAGIPVGATGHVAATSFYPTKNLGCFGDGGAAFTGNAEIAELLRSLRDYGQTQKYVHSHLGSNSRLDELQAAILRDALLPRLPAATSRRQVIASVYREEIHHPDISIPDPPEDSESVYHLFPVIVKGSRDSLMRHLKENGIQSGIHYPVLLPSQPAMLSIEHTVIGKMTQAQGFAENELSLPIHPYLDDEGLDRVVAACNGWLKE